ncbi:MAG: 23S rRNA (pseudouridine(1915)-N(3))-methyltransferase RlmH [Pseudomonadota bacterium]
MQLKLICVGKMKAGPERDLLDRYADRIRKLAPQLGMSWSGISEVPESRAPDGKTRKTQEATALNAHVKADRAVIIVLDERGDSLDSTRWASLIDRHREAGASELIVMIGGPDGLDSQLRGRADKCISFGNQTMPHQLVRIIATEQLYRVLTILNGHPYHRQ